MNHPNFPAIPIAGYLSQWSEPEQRFVPGTIPYETDFLVELHRTRDGYYKAIIDELRALAPELKTAFKAEKLTGLTISCVTRKWRNTENIISYSGLINIDIDDKHNPKLQTREDFAKLRDTLAELPLVLAAWVSASGLGVTFVVKTKPGPLEISPKQDPLGFMKLKDHHRAIFESIRAELREAFDINIDKATHDITRLRFVSYDPDIKIKEDFASVPPLKPKIVDKKKPVINFKPTKELDSDYNFEKCAETAQAKEWSFVQGQMHNYLASLAGKANSLGMSLEFIEAKVVEKYGDEALSMEDLLRPIKAVYRSYSKQHGQYSKYLEEKEELAPIYALAHTMNRAGRMWTDTDVSEVSDSLLIDPLRVRKVFEEVFTEHADEFNIDNKPVIVRVESYLNRKYEFIKNEVSLKKEYRPRGSDQAWEKVIPEELWRELEHDGFKWELTKVKALMKTSFVPSYNPFEDYFTTLPEWDPASDPDYITQLADYITTEDQPFYRTQFKKALVRSIACSLDGYVNRIVFVLVGEKQETGKSSFIRFLNPFGKNYYTESPLRDGKDTQFKYSENFIYNLDELSSLNNLEINRLKAIISTANIKERKPYADDEEQQPRRCNFWGSTNKSDFLTDTENTRWLIFTVKNVDFGYFNTITKEGTVDINKVWSQAYSLYKSGFNFELTKEEQAQREEINKQHEVASTERDLIAKYLKKPALETKDYFMNNTEILELLQNKTDNKIKLNTVVLGKAMKQLNFTPGMRKINGKQLKGYYCQEVTDSIGYEFDLDTDLPVQEPFAAPDPDLEF